VPYAETAPPPDLASLVECFWRIDGAVGEHRVLPDGCIDIILLNGEARVVGTMTRAIMAGASAEPIVGARFRPGEAARIVPLAPHELTDLDAPLSAAWGDDGKVLDDASRTIDVLAGAVRARLARHGEAVDLPIRAAAGVLQHGATVRAAAEHVGMSERNLARRFIARVGIAPKTFGRVMRLRRAVSAIHCGANASRAASIAGYVDQAHFTRDAKALAGVTPVRFVQDARLAAQ
jgi:AraC-like DNA-binding protein